MGWTVVEMVGLVGCVEFLLSQTARVDCNLLSRRVRLRWFEGRKVSSRPEAVGRRFEAVGRGLARSF